MMKPSQALATRVVAHVAAWLPFLAATAGTLRVSWRVVGDGSSIALQSWQELTGAGPLTGPVTELGFRLLHDPGPLEYWLLAVPVHLDPVRGVLWGAALWGMAAASLAIEAMWSVLGQAGGVLASGAVLWAVAWRPGIASKPYWNPWFGTMFFLAALAACWAVMSGRRWWWPVLVVTASVAAQAHLMFALASAAVVLLALVTGLADASRSGTGYRWAAVGLAAGLACWAAPVVQQVAGPGPGNLTGLIHGQATGPRTGPVFALNILGASVRPVPVWWLFPQQPMTVAAWLTGRGPALLGVAGLAAVTAALLAGLWWLRSRRLAALAGLSLLTSAAALVTFSRIPLKGDSLAPRVVPDDGPVPGGPAGLARHRLGRAGHGLACDGPPAATTAARGTARPAAGSGPGLGPPGRPRRGHHGRTAPRARVLAGGGPARAAPAARRPSRAGGRRLLPAGRAGAAPAAGQPHGGGRRRARAPPAQGGPRVGTHRCRLPRAARAAPGGHAAAPDSGSPAQHHSLGGHGHGGRDKPATGVTMRLSAAYT
jgi:hypothetical protein